MRAIDNSRDGALAIIKFFRSNEKRSAHRDDIMFAANFPSPKAEPVCAYVLFANSLMEANRRLRGLSGRIERVVSQARDKKGRQLEYYAAVGHMFSKPTKASQ